MIREDFSPDILAQSYAEGGATCLSVLTDEPYFQGNDTYLQQARNACTLPVLRKDFMLDTYQVTESRALGADCILLIMAALENQQACELLHAAAELGMDALVEVHDEWELERAVEKVEADLIGVNNRDLKTLTIDLETSRRLARYMPRSCTRVSESGIYTHEDIVQLQQCGYNAFLVGESLMREPDVTQATRALLNL